MIALDHSKSHKEMLSMVVTAFYGLLLRIKQKRDKACLVPDCHGNV